MLITVAPVWRYIAWKNHWAAYSELGRLDIMYDSILMGALLAQLQRIPTFRTLLAGFPLPGLLLALAGVGFLTLSIRMLPPGNAGFLATTTVQLLCAFVALKPLILTRPLKATPQGDEDIATPLTDGEATSPSPSRAIPKIRRGRMCPDPPVPQRFAARLASRITRSQSKAGPGSTFPFCTW
jgi:hypothetical protein